MARTEETQYNLLKQVLTDISNIKNSLPGGELKQISETIVDLKSDIGELKRVLLNPTDGIIVKTNKNSEILDEFRRKSEQADSYLSEFKDVLKWKEGVNKALWIIFTTILAIIIKLIFVGYDIDL